MPLEITKGRLLDIAKVLAGGGLPYDEFYPEIFSLAKTATLNPAATYNPTTDAQLGKTPNTHTHYDLEKVVDGAVAEDTPALANETGFAQSAAANDMTLLPAAEAIDDAYYFGFNYMWDNLLLNIGTQGVGGWTIVWEYYSSVGPVWAALAGVTDGTAGFTAAVGIRTVLFTRPFADWTLFNVGGFGNMYWIRARVTAIAAHVTQPKGTQAWCRIIT